MPKPTHVYLSADELHDVIVDAMRAFILSTHKGIAVRPAAEAAIALAVCNAIDAYETRLSPSYLRAVSR